MADDRLVLKPGYVLAAAQNLVIQGEELENTAALFTHTLTATQAGSAAAVAAITDFFTSAAHARVENATVIVRVGERVRQAVAVLQTSDESNAAATRQVGGQLDRVMPSQLRPSAPEWMAQ